MKNSIRTLAASYFARVALFSLITMNTQLFGQNASRANRPAATAKPKSTANSKARMERVANGIDPIDLTKGKAPVRLDILKLMNLYNLTGLSVAVIEDYKIAWTKCYGVTEPSGTVPLTPKTLFQAGSISKPVAAAGMLALVQEGKLSLDEDVNVKLKSWKVTENEFTKDQKVTLRRLASHSAGLTVHGFPRLRRGRQNSYPGANLRWRNTSEHCCDSRGFCARQRRALLGRGHHNRTAIDDRCEWKALSGVDERNRAGQDRNE